MHSLVLSVYWKEWVGVACAGLDGVQILQIYFCEDKSSSPRQNRKDANKGKKAFNKIARQFILCKHPHVDNNNNNDNKQS